MWPNFRSTPGGCQNSAFAHDDARREYCPGCVGCLYSAALAGRGPGGYHLAGTPSYQGLQTEYFMSDVQSHPGLPSLPGKGKRGKLGQFVYAASSYLTCELVERERKKSPRHPILERGIYTGVTGRKESQPATSAKQRGHPPRTIDTRSRTVCVLSCN